LNSLLNRYDTRMAVEPTSSKARRDELPRAWLDHLFQRAIIA